jgi:hypothetical protein
MQLPDKTPARLQAPVLTPVIHHHALLLYLDSLSPPTFVPFSINHPPLPSS